MTVLKGTLLAATIAIALASPVQADSLTSSDVAADTSQAAPLQLTWDARLRNEQVDDAAFDNKANATTLRLRLGMLANFGSGWSGLLEGAGVTSLNNHYNSGANGQTSYPGITDPRGGELNQAWVRWQDSQFTATVGRQELMLDNQRWVGNVGWRQLEQTYDAIALQWQPSNSWTIRYDWLDRVHRVFGPDAINPLASARKLNTNLFNVAYSQGAQTWVGYAYLHEDRDVPAASTATYGLRWCGSALQQGNGPGWTVEYARQSDYSNNPDNYGVNYWLVEPSWTVQGITARIGLEQLGGDRLHALQTPLATLHAFNGWDDQFLATPAGGLEDRYITMTGKFTPYILARRLTWVVGYHDYHAVTGSEYGNEGDASLGVPLPGGVQALVKVASYHANGFGHNDTKIWLQLQWSGKQKL